MSKKTVLSEILKQDNQKKQKLEIVIYPELQELIPPLTDEEIKGLEESILSEGCREALLIWENGEENVLIDGHNRYAICERNNLFYSTKIKSFENIEAVKNWMISNQLGRRNLTELQKSYLRGLQYNREKKGLGGDRKSEKSSTQNEYLKTVDKLAEEHKVSKATIQRDEKFALGLDKLTEGNKDLKDKILKKEVKVPQSLVQEASGWDKEKIKEAVKTIQKGETLNNSTNSKESQEGTKESILKEINRILKGYTYEKLLEVKNNLE
jgi:hypothetical protein